MHKQELLGSRLRTRYEEKEVVAISDGGLYLGKVYSGHTYEVEYIPDEELKILLAKRGSKR